MISSLVNSGESGQTIAYTVLLISFVFQGFMNDPNSINYFYTDGLLAQILLTILNFYPGFNYTKIYCDLVFYSGSRFDVASRTFVKGKKFQWENLFHNYLKSSFRGDLIIPSTFYTICLLVRNIVLFYAVIIINEKIRSK